MVSLIINVSGALGFNPSSYPPKLSQFFLKNICQFRNQETIGGLIGPLWCYLQARPFSYPACN